MLTRTIIKIEWRTMRLKKRLQLCRIRNNNRTRQCIIKCILTARHPRLKALYNRPRQLITYPKCRPGYIRGVLYKPKRKARNLTKRRLEGRRRSHGIIDMPSHIVGSAGDDENDATRHQHRSNQLSTIGGDNGVVNANNSVSLHRAADWQQTGHTEEQGYYTPPHGGTSPLSSTHQGHQTGLQTGISPITQGQ